MKQKKQRKPLSGWPTIAVTLAVTAPFGHHAELPLGPFAAKALGRILGADRLPDRGPGRNRRPGNPLEDGMMELVLSLFPGLDLLGHAFTEEGFSVVRGPDPLYNSRIEDFHIPAGTVTGIIAGPPCQDFSKARRCKPSGHGLRMLGELLRVIDEARPEWVLIENVPQVPERRPPGLQPPAAGHSRLRMRRHPASTPARPVPLHVRSHHPAPPRIPTAASRGHSHLGNRSSVTHLCGDLPPPGFCRTCHAARLVGKPKSGR